MEIRVEYFEDDNSARYTYRFVRGDRWTFLTDDWSETSKYYYDKLDKGKPIKFEIEYLYELS